MCWSRHTVGGVRQRTIMAQGLQHTAVAATAAPPMHVLNEPASVDFAALPGSLMVQLSSRIKTYLVHSCTRRVISLGGVGSMQYFCEEPYKNAGYLAGVRGEHVVTACLASACMACKACTPNKMHQPCISCLAWTRCMPCGMPLHAYGWLTLQTFPCSVPRLQRLHRGLLQAVLLLLVSAIVGLWDFLFWFGAGCKEWLWPPFSPLPACTTLPQPIPADTLHACMQHTLPVASRMQYSCMHHPLM